MAWGGLIACLALTGLAFTGAGCAGTRYERSTGAYLDDKSISTRVKTALFRDPDVSGFDVNVNTFRGDVQLSGFVDTAQQKQKATEIAREVSGVEMVTNNLEIKPAGTAVGAAGGPVEGRSGTTTQPAPVRGGSDLGSPRGSLDQQGWRPSQPSSNLNRDLNQDLNQTNPSDRIQSDIGADLQSDTGTALGTPPSSMDASRSVGSPLATGQMGPQNLEIDAADGTATIRGSVASETEKQNIEQCVRQIPGINNVENQLEVQSQSQNPAGQEQNPADQ